LIARWQHCTTLVVFALPHVREPRALIIKYIRHPFSNALLAPALGAALALSVTSPEITKAQQAKVPPAAQCQTQYQECENNPSTDKAQCAGTWSSCVRSQSSFMQMAGETASESTASISSSMLSYPSISSIDRPDRNDKSGPENSCRQPLLSLGIATIG
jgi:hypothetical protein